MKRKNEKAITLIALIITIIIMLILAGVVISLTIGENGLFNTAKYAAKKWNNEVEKEQQEIDNLDNLLYYASFEDMLRECEVDTKYTLEDLVNNKDGILEKVLSNNNAVDYILSNSDDYLDAFVGSEIAVVMLAQKENTRGKVINNSEWLNGIQTSINEGSFDKNMEAIPVMTSNNTPSGEVIVGGYYGKQYPYYAFDGNTDTYFYRNDSNNDYTIIYKFDNKKLLYKFSVIISNITSWTSSNQFVIYISQDESGDNWEEIKNDKWNWQQNQYGVNRDEVIILEKPIRVRRIKVYSHVLTQQGANVTNGVRKIQAYGI